MRISSSLDAIQRASTDLNARAERLARSGAGGDATAEELVALRRHRHEVAINAGVIRAQDDALGVLLDVLA